MSKKRKVLFICGNPDSIISISLFLCVLSFIFALDSKAEIFNYNLTGRPTSLNPLRYSDGHAGTVIGQVIESLARRSLESNKWEPELAIKWKLSKDGKTLAVNLRKGVTWHDGKPFTAEDVKFSFDAIVDAQNRYGTANYAFYYREIERVQVINSHQVKFFFRDTYFKNLDLILGMAILPRHIYGDTSKQNQRRLNKAIWGSGPYKFNFYNRNKFIELTKNKHWWGNQSLDRAGEANFSRIRFHFYFDDGLALRFLQQGKLDFLSMTTEIFNKKAVGSKWGKEVFKVKTRNKRPLEYSFIALNQKKIIFKDKRVRLALHHLIDRKKMKKKFLFNEVNLVAGPWGSELYVDSKVEPIEFNPKRARKLLLEAGWRDTDGDLVLDKVMAGKKISLRFSILEPHAEYMKILLAFKEDARKEGIEINIKRIEWNAFMNLIDKQKFDAARLSWGGGAIDIDPKGIWHSSSSAAGGSNFISYKNLKVDKLIEQGRMTLNRKERIKKFRQAYRLIAEDVPYLFLFSKKNIFYGHSKRTKRVKDTYPYGIGEMRYWWIKK